MSQNKPELAGRENVISPLVHLGGTSSDRLEEQLRTAGAAGRKFLDALAEAEPHGRDYLPLGSEAYAKARRHHEARLALVRSIVEELESIAFGIVQREAR